MLKPVDIIAKLPEMDTFFINGILAKYLECADPAEYLKASGTDSVLEFEVDDHSVNFLKRDFENVSVVSNRISLLGHRWN